MIRNNKSYFPIVIASPSGGGKTTIVKGILRKRSDIVYSISYTTRERRKNEINEKDYFFVSKTEFIAMRESGKFLEWAKVHNFYYGTSKRFVETNMQNKKLVIMDIDVQGARQVRQKIPNTLSIFVIPPSFKILKERLIKRDTEQNESLKIRIENVHREVQCLPEFNYLVINDNLNKTVSKVLNIIDAYQHNLIVWKDNKEYFDNIFNEFYEEDNNVD
ncbi:MAG: guanylate kinase [Candidatus Cloacimonadota bacterium]|nr:MAG: guanylate kinase [Candidatus Cloacimonadota bacterium]